MLFLSVPAWANESASQITTGEVKKEKAEAGTDEADQVITNRRFRASNGSLSKLSMNLNLNYQGGSLDRPFAADRPNLNTAGDTASVAAFSGIISGSYRLNALNRVGFAAGVSMVAPFNDSIDTDQAAAQKQFDENHRDLDISNPRLSYTHMNKFAGIQTIITGEVLQYTQGTFTDFGYQNKASLLVNTMYEVGNTGFSFGAYTIFERNFFDDTQTNPANQLETVFGFLPQAEYVINDTFNLRTIVRSHWYDNSKAVRSGNFRKRPVTQSIGLGISLSRDVFLYPNFQFAWDNVEAETTNVGLSANINMF